MVFRVPDYCRFLTSLTREALINRAGLLTPSEKNELLLSSLPALRVEMSHQQRLHSCSKVFLLSQPSVWPGSPTTGTSGLCSTSSSSSPSTSLSSSAPLTSSTSTTGSHLFSSPSSCCSDSSRSWLRSLLSSATSSTPTLFCLSLTPLLPPSRSKSLPLESIAPACISSSKIKTTPHLLRLVPRAAGVSESSKMGNCDGSW